MPGSITLTEYIAVCYGAGRKPARLIFWQPMQVPFMQRFWRFMVLELITTFDLWIVHSHLINSFHEIVLQVPVAGMDQLKE